MIVHLVTRSTSISSTPSWSALMTVLPSQWPISVLPGRRSGFYDSWTFFNTHPVGDFAPFLSNFARLVPFLVAYTQTRDKFLITRFLLSIDVTINCFVTDDFTACFQGHDPANVFGGPLFSQALDYLFFERSLEFIGFSFSHSCTDLLSIGGLIGIGLIIAS